MSRPIGGEPPRTPANQRPVSSPAAAPTIPVPAQGTVLRRTSWLMAGVGGAVVLSAVGMLPADLSHGVPLVFPILAVLLGAGLLSRPIRQHRLRLMALAGVEIVLLALMLPDMRDLLAVRTSGRAPAGARSVSLVELNVWDLNSDPARTIAWLRSTNADVIVLAEARERFVAELVKAFPDYPTMITCEARPYCGEVILSRFSGRRIPGGWWVADGLRHSLPVDQGLALAAVELSIPDTDGRDQPTPVVTVHIDRRGFSSITDGQIGALLQAVDVARGRFRSRLILAGDFNASPWSPQMRRFDQAVGAARISAFSPTWPTILQVLAIDQAYLGCAWKARQLRVGEDVGSDHRPLIARFDLQPEATPGCPG